MMGSVDPNIRRGLIRATLHLTNREYAALADDFITLGFLPSGSNKAEIVPALTGVCIPNQIGHISNNTYNLPGFSGCPRWRCEQFVVW